MIVYINVCKDQMSYYNSISAGAPKSKFTMSGLKLDVPLHIYMNRVDFVIPLSNNRKTAISPLYALTCGAPEVITQMTCMIRHTQHSIPKVSKVIDMVVVGDKEEDN